MSSESDTNVKDEIEKIKKMKDPTTRCIYASQRDLLWKNPENIIKFKLVDHVIKNHPKLAHHFADWIHVQTKYCNAENGGSKYSSDLNVNYN